MKQKPTDRKQKLKLQRLDPRYASVRPWDWRLCRDCATLVPESCPNCGGTDFSKRPRDIMNAAIRQQGFPPGLL